MPVSAPSYPMIMPATPAAMSAMPKADARMLSLLLAAFVSEKTIAGAEKQRIDAILRRLCAILRRRFAVTHPPRHFGNVSSRCFSQTQ
jgi:hypothetical protein